MNPRQVTHLPLWNHVPKRKAIRVASERHRQSEVNKTAYVSKRRQMYSNTSPLNRQSADSPISVGTRCNRSCPLFLSGIVLIYSFNNHQLQEAYLDVAQNYTFNLYRAVNKTTYVRATHPTRTHARFTRTSAVCMACDCTYCKVGRLYLK